MPTSVDEAQHFHAKDLVKSRYPVNLFHVAGAAKQLTDAYVEGDGFDGQRHGSVRYFVTYTKGDEASMEFMPIYSDDSNGPYVEDPFLHAPSAGVIAPTFEPIQQTASKAFCVVVSLANVNFVNVKLKATGGTPGGRGTVLVTAVGGLSL